VQRVAVQRATQGALDVAGTASALEQTATGAAVAFDSTRTAVALFAQSTADAGTRAAVERFEQRAATREAAGTAVARTATAQPPGEIVPQAGSETQPETLPTLDASRFNVYFADDFEDELDLAWTVNGDWRAENGAAFATICGTSLLVGDTAWANFAIETRVYDTADAQFAVITGYGDGGRLYINFGLGGAVWWLVENEAAIPDETINNAYDPAQPNRVRVTVEGRVVSVNVNGDTVTERLLPKAAHGPVGLYTCPANDSVPRFERFRVVRLP
jgi:hypothetical protein